MKETKTSFFLKTLVVVLLALVGSQVYSQSIDVLNEKGKKIYTIKEGKDLDFRINYSKLYPENQNDILESRIFGYIDSISGNKLHLVESQIIIDFTKDSFNLVEKDYEYTDLWINLGDIKSMSFNPTMASIGNSLLIIGLATIVASPLLGLTPSGYSTERFVQVAGIGLGTAVIGGSFYLAFGQKPVKFKEFDGPDYFKKYQKGSLSNAE